MIQSIQARGLAALASSAVRLAPADVIHVDGGLVVVSFGVRQAEAQLAMLDYQPVLGDRVLVVGDDESGQFVIGVLATATPRPRLRVETSAASGATILSVEQGDLEVVAPHGAVRIISYAGIEAVTAGPIELKSCVSVRMAVLDRLGKALSRMGLSRRSAELQHDELEVSTKRLHVSAGSGQLASDDCSVDVGSLSLAARRVNADVGTLLTSIENAYHRIAGLWQLAAQRTRMVVAETSHHLARRLYSKADDVKVKADRIHLG